MHTIGYWRIVIGLYIQYTSTNGPEGILDTAMPAERSKVHLLFINSNELNLN